MALGAAGTVVTIARRDPSAVPLALGYFTAMEALQLAGYAVLDACGSPLNQVVTLLSFLHIVFQPFIINAFAMELVATADKARARPWVYGACTISAVVMLLQLYPFDWAGACRAGTTLCGPALCTVAGNWHIAWQIPYNGLLLPLEALTGTWFGFPTYMLAVFVLPLAYGAWRFTLFHALAGPVLASLLTDSPNEMPAIWCLFSVGIVLFGLSPWLRAGVSRPGGWGRPAILAEEPAR
jgi:hypothetical protein